MSRPRPYPLGLAQQIEFGAALREAERLRIAGQTAEAEQTCRKVLGLHRFPPALHVLALLRADLGDLSEATSLMREAVNSAPDEAVFHNHLGSLLFRQGDTEAAKEEHQKAVNLNSDYPEAYYNLGVALAVLGETDKALAAQRRAIGLKPSYPQAQVQAGSLLYQLGNHDAALALLDTVVAETPEYFDAHYYRGVVLAAKGHYAPAALAQQKAVAIAPRRFEGNLALGNALAQIGREKEALAAYRRAIEADPSYLPAHQEFNDLAWTLGLDIRTLGSYAYARTRLGDTPDLLLAEAELRLRLEEAGEAHALLERAQAQAPTRADIANARARAFLMQKRFDQAQEQFTTAIATEPQTISHRQGLATALLRNAHPKAAMNALEDALAIQPHNQTTLGYLTLAARAVDEKAFAYLVNFEDCVHEIMLPPPPGFVDSASFHAALAQELTVLHTRKVAPIDQTLNGGTQTPGALFNRDSRLLLLLQDSLREAVRTYLQSIPDDPDHPFLSRKHEGFDFAGSWSCRLYSNGYHVNHVHSQGWISSAYYVDLPRLVSEGKERQGALKFGESPFGLGEADRPLRFVTPAIGKLVLFPSYFWHGTVPFTADRARLTVAFDAVPR